MNESRANNNTMYFYKFTQANDVVNYVAATTSGQ